MRASRAEKSSGCPSLRATYPVRLSSAAGRAKNGRDVLGCGSDISSCSTRKRVDRRRSKVRISTGTSRCARVSSVDASAFRTSSHSAAVRDACAGSRSQLPPAALTSTPDRITRAELTRMSSDAVAPAASVSGSDRAGSNAMRLTRTR